MQNPSGAQYCSRCGVSIGQLPQVTPYAQPQMQQQVPPPGQPQMQQPYYPQQQPIMAPSAPPAPPKSRTPVIAIGIVIAVIAVIAIVILAVVLLAFGEKYPLDVGDYLEYTYFGTSFFSSYSGTVMIQVTGETETTYTITVSYTGDYYESPESYTFSKKETMEDSGAYGELGMNMGAETITTEIGTRTCYHYQNSEAGTDYHYWIGQENGILYKMTIDTLVGDLIFVLHETNIGWV